MRSKLHLSDEELMRKSWIAVNLEMHDFPYYDYNAKSTVSKDDTGSTLAKILGA